MNRTTRQLAVAFGLIVITSNSFADCVADLNVKQARSFYQNGERLEAQKNYWSALQAYESARGYVCESGDNPVAEKALQKAIALAKQGGLQQEKQANFYNESASAGAFQWYEAGAQFADADRALLAEIKLRPHDKMLAAFALTHFSERAAPAFAANHREAIAATGGYQLDQQAYAYVQTLPTKNVERLLAQYSSILPDEYLKQLSQLEAQKQTIKPGDVMAMMQLQTQAGQWQQKWQSDRLRDVEKLFGETQQWIQLVLDDSRNQALNNRLLQAQLAHAERLSKSYANVALLVEDALSYLLRQDKTTAIAALRQKASQQAMQAMKTQQFEMAARWYELADDDANADKARQQMNAQRDVLAQQAQQNYGTQIADLQKLYADPKKIQEMQQQALELQKQMQQSLPAEDDN